MRADASQPLRLKPVSDERLVERLRAGDSRAFESIYDRYERPIRSFCRHMLGQPEDADDAVQHTFLAAYRQLAGSGKAIELRPWLFTIARNRCRTLLRARYRGLAFSESMEYEPSAEGLTAEVERREHLRDLMRDIARLPEDQRAALLLTQLETLSHDEVASVLDVPAEKVKALVFQARSSLVASELARETPCGEIREQLATLSGAGLRRRTLRRHVRDCAGCREFELRLRRQRHAILVLLPVAASAGVRQAVAAHLVGGGAAAGGAAAGGIAAGGGGVAGGGFTSLVGNAVAVKTATVLSVAAAGAGVVAVTSGTRAVRAIHQSGAQGGAAVVAGPPHASPRIALSPSAAHSPTGPASPVRRSAPQRHHVPARTKRAHLPKPHPASPRTLAIAQPVAGGGNGDSGGQVGGAPPNQPKQQGRGSPPPGQVKQQEPGSPPPGQAKQPEPGSLPPGQAKGDGSGSLPPGQAKKLESPTVATTPPGNGSDSSPSDGKGNGKPGD